MNRGILIAAFDFAGAHADEFHDWYDLEHVPERQRIPGFGACERWIDTANPKRAIATYDLDSVEVMRSAPYLAIAHDNLSVWSKRVTAMCERLVRFEGEQTLPGDRNSPAGAGGLLLNAMNVSPDREVEFNEWYDTEHIPALAAVPGTLCARRFRAAEGSPRHVALYHLASPDVVRSKAWKDAASTPWTERLRPHFRDHLRIVGRRYTRAK